MSQALVNAAGAVRNDLTGVASGAVSAPAQFAAHESTLQTAINVVQQELGLGRARRSQAPERAHPRRHDWVGVLFVPVRRLAIDRSVPLLGINSQPAM